MFEIYISLESGRDPKAFCLKLHEYDLLGDTYFLKGDNPTCDLKIVIRGKPSYEELCPIFAYVMEITEPGEVTGFDYLFIEDNINEISDRISREFFPPK